MGQIWTEKIQRRGPRGGKRIQVFPQFLFEGGIQMAPLATMGLAMKRVLKAWSMPVNPHSLCVQLVVNKAYLVNEFLILLSVIHWVGGIIFLDLRQGK